MKPNREFPKFVFRSRESVPKGKLVEERARENKQRQKFNFLAFRLNAASEKSS